MRTFGFCFSFRHIGTSFGLAVPSFSMPLSLSMAINKSASFTIFVTGAGAPAGYKEESYDLMTRKTKAKKRRPTANLLGRAEYYCTGTVPVTGMPPTEPVTQE
jgi:hypothetical protein